VKKKFNFTLRVWRQSGSSDPGRFVDYPVQDMSPDSSFLEMLDVVNSRLEVKGEEPIAFSHDCREGICGSCGVMVNGIPHGPGRGIATCQLYMRSFSEGDVILVEPWRAKAFTVLKDLIVDRRSLDRIITAGGYVSVNTGAAQDGNSIPIPRDIAEKSMDAAACIGCGACVAACPNGSAMLFTSAKVGQLALLPQGKVERFRRVVDMVNAHDDAGFGACSNTGACEVACPKEIRFSHIARLNREYFLAKLLNRQ